MSNKRHTEVTNPLPPRLAAAYHRLPSHLRTLVVGNYWRLLDLLDFTAELVCAIPSHTLRRFFLIHMLGVHIGPSTNVHRGCRLYSPRNIKIGSHTVINRDVLLDGRAGLFIGDNVSVSERVVILTLEHDPNDRDFASRGGQVRVEDKVFIGVHAIILPGIQVSEGAVIAAGAVVTSDVPAYSIYAGVPARSIGERRRDLCYQLDYRKFLG